MEKDADRITVRLCGKDRGALESLPGALADLGFQVSTAGKSTIRETYLDTEDWLLYRAGAALCLRTAKGEATLALELICPRDALPLPARDLEEPLEEPPADFPCAVPGRRLRALTVPVLGDAPVAPRLKLRRESSALQATGPDGVEFDVAANLVRLHGRRSTEAFAEVRLSASRVAGEGFQKAVDGIVSRLGTTQPCASSLGAGLQMAGADVPELLEGDDLRLRRSDRFIDAAYRVLRVHLARMLWNEPGTRLGLDAEYLHDMRVATRRLRSAFRMFRKVLPRRGADRLIRDLRWLGGALGKVRDLDVYLIQVQDDVRAVEPELQPAMDMYLDHLGKRRKSARRSMLRALDSKRYAEFVGRFQRWLDAGPPGEPAAPEAAEPATGAARRLVRRRLKRVLREGRALAPDSPDKDLHVARIRCKRLRYACEAFTDLYGSPAAGFARRAKGLQDILGMHQDAVVAGEALSRFAAEVSGPEEQTHRLELAIGQLTQAHARRARDSRAEFFRAWKRFDQKKVRRPLKDRLNKLRPKK